MAGVWFFEMQWEWNLFWAKIYWTSSKLGGSVEFVREFVWEGSGEGSMGRKMAHMRRAGCFAGSAGVSHSETCAIVTNSTINPYACAIESEKKKTTERGTGGRRRNPRIWRNPPSLPCCLSFSLALARCLYRSCAPLWQHISVAR